MLFLKLILTPNFSSPILEENSWCEDSISHLVTKTSLSHDKIISRGMIQTRNATLILFKQSKLYAEHIIDQR